MLAILQGSGMVIAMIASYVSSEYEFSGVTDTETYLTDFVFTRRRPVRAGGAILPETSKRRYLDRLYPHAQLSKFDVIEPTMTDGEQEGFNLPRIKIMGLLFIDPPAPTLDAISTEMIDAFGPVTPEVLERNMAEGLLRKCGEIILSEFEGIMLPSNVNVASK